ncbi:hypothetical protein KU06112801_60016 [Flavobacterium psychrophilum]|uniref:lantibiotic dehydratase n=1 Tax=Flavobacterium psychrophilum TaxID=96345 RepID=UPI000B7C13BB|nr:lantibiotic dehydratase [Flavobacterium psychrophilum]SNB17909.1 hypothetical protein KU06112801_60016 [Flavobacterium psychrophilum]
MEFFDTIIKRVVSFPVQSYEENKNKIIDFFSNNELFQLSVLISSRTLFNDSQKNKNEKVELSLEKYFSRAHYNPVPFGTFSSVGVLQWGAETKVIKQDGLHLKVDFDNSLITNNVNKSIETDWKNFEYLTNPSLHFLQSEKICYYKTEIKEKGVFETEFIEIDFDENTEWLINRFKNGAKIEDVTLDLVEMGFEKIETDDFLFEIIKVGLIINRFLLNPYNNKKNLDYLNSSLVNQNVHDLVSKKTYATFSEKLIEEQNNIQESNRSEKNIFAITSFEKTTVF